MSTPYALFVSRCIILTILCPKWTLVVSNQALICYAVAGGEINLLFTDYTLLMTSVPGRYFRYITELTTQLKQLMKCYFLCLEIAVNLTHWSRLLFCKEMRNWSMWGWGQNSVEKSLEFQSWGILDISQAYRPPRPVAGIAWIYFFLGGGLIFSMSDVSFIVRVALFTVFRLSVVCCFVLFLCVVSYCSTTATGQNLIWSYI
jgi:hypothetical protein